MQEKLSLEKQQQEKLEASRKNKQPRRKQRGMYPKEIKYRARRA